jgi:hypothetical protein
MQISFIGTHGHKCHNITSAKLEILFVYLKVHVKFINLCGLYIGNHGV